MTAFACLFLSSCEKKADEQIRPYPVPVIDSEEVIQDPIDAYMESMSLEEKVGQLFIIRPDSLDPDLNCDEIADSSSEGVKTVSDSMWDTLVSYPCGGFAIFGKNIEDPSQLSEFNSDLASICTTAPFMAVDEEGGMVSRLANHDAFDLPVFENMQDIAERGDRSEAYEMGRTIAAYLREYGFNFDFAPVADVNTNPDNPVIGRRAFGDDPVTAGKMVSAVVKGLLSEGIIPCIKHFPGHGDTSTDTHLGYAETGKNWDEMMDCEMIPFFSGIEAGCPVVMVAHIAAPEVTGTDEPASLSYTLISEKLRGEMSFDGVVITDSMAMDAIAASYSSSDAAVKSVLAGADIILMPYDYKEAFDGIVCAVKDGIISENRLDESVRRILSLKMAMEVIQ